MITNETWQLFFPSLSTSFFFLFSNLCSLPFHGRPIPCVAKDNISSQLYLTKLDSSVPSVLLRIHYFACLVEVFMHDLGWKKNSDKRISSEMGKRAKGTSLNISSRNYETINQFQWPETKCFTFTIFHTSNCVAFHCFHLLSESRKNHAKQCLSGMRSENKVPRTKLEICHIFFRFTLLC